MGFCIDCPASNRIGVLATDYEYPPIVLDGGIPSTSGLTHPMPFLMELYDDLTVSRGGRRFLTPGFIQQVSKRTLYLPSPFRLQS